jgi:hypothetical protein
VGKTKAVVHDVDEGTTPSKMLLLLKERRIKFCLMAELTSVKSSHTYRLFDAPFLSPIKKYEHPTVSLLVTWIGRKALTFL